MLTKVLFPTDFSEGAYKTIRIFEKRNKIQIGQLILLHVVDETLLEEMFDGYSLLYNNEDKELLDIETKLREDRMKKLQEKSKLAQEILNPKDIKLIVKFGIPYKKILETAEEEDVSLILLPSHGKSDFSHEILGSTTCRILKKAKRPVLLIKTCEEVGK